MHRKYATKSIRRIVTEHNEAAKPIAFSATDVPIKAWPGADAGGAVVWSIARVTAVTDVILDDYASFGGKT